MKLRNALLWVCCAGWFVCTGAAMLRRGLGDAGWQDSLRHAIAFCGAGFVLSIQRRDAGSNE